jgi:predicted nucleotidyltransferase
MMTMPPGRSTCCLLSDVDVLVECEDDARVSLFNMAQMARELSSLFHDRPVDIMTTSVLRNPYRRRAILKDLERIYGVRGAR